MLWDRVIDTLLVSFLFAIKFKAMQACGTTWKKECIHAYLERVPHILQYRKYN